MDRSAVAKAKVNRKHRTKVARRGSSEGRRASGRDVARPANDTDFEATQVSEPGTDEKQLADAEPEDVSAATDPSEGDLAAFEGDLGEVDVTVVTEASEASDD